MPRLVTEPDAVEHGGGVKVIWPASINETAGLVAAVRLPLLGPVAEARVIQRPDKRPVREVVAEQAPLVYVKVPASGNWPAEFGVVDWVRTMLTVPTVSGPEPEPAGLG
jgi:hypothetical protein